MSNDSISQNLIGLDILSNMYTYKRLSVNNSKHEYEITVSNDYIEQKMNSRLKEISRNTKFPGFRSGKVPYSIIIKNYKNEVLEYVVNNVINNFSSDLMKKIEINFYFHSKINIISLPDLNKKNSEKKSCFIYRLSFETIPEIPLIDLSKINLKKIEVKIEDEDIDKFIDSIKIKFPNFVSITDSFYKSKYGDNMNIDFEGRIRNKIFQGGSGKNFNINIGSKSFISGFEDHLVGMKKGEIKSFKLKFPKDYNTISLAGQEATFFVRVNDIQVAKNFENNDQIAIKNGFKNYSLLRDHAKKIIDKECKEIIKVLIKKELFDYLDNNYKFDLPSDIIKNEEKKIEKNFTFKLYDSFNEAKRRVKLGMLFMKFSEKYEILITKSDILNTILDKYVSKDSSLNKVLKNFNSDKKFQELVKGQALENKIVNFIIEKVNKEKSIVSVKMLMELFNNIFNKEKYDSHTNCS